MILKPSEMHRRWRLFTTSCAYRCAICGLALCAWKSCGLIIEPWVMFFNMPVYPQIEWSFIVEMLMMAVASVRNLVNFVPMPSTLISSMVVVPLLCVYDFTPPGSTLSLMRVPARNVGYCS